MKSKKTKKNKTNKKTKKKEKKRTPKSSCDDEVRQSDDEEEAICDIYTHTKRGKEATLDHFTTLF